MDGPGGQLLARAALARDQDGRVRGSDLLDQVEDFAHGPALADDVVEARGVPDRPLEQDVLLAEPPLFEPVGEDDLQLLDLERLDDVVQGAHLEGLDRLLDAPVGRDHDHRRERMQLLRSGQDLHPVHVRHLDVADEGVILARLDEVEHLGGPRVQSDPVAFLLEHDAEELEDALLVVDDQEAHHGRASFSFAAAQGRGKARTIDVPAWGAEFTEIVPRRSETRRSTTAIPSPFPFSKRV